MMTIKQATSDDCQLIHEMAWQAFPPAYKGILSEAQTKYMMEWMYSLPSLHQQMAEGHVFLLAYEDTQPVGYVSIEQQAADLFHLQKIYVLPAWQGKHVGRFLFCEAVAYIRRIHPGCCTMELNVNRHNPALGFYEHMGMRCVREGDFPIGNGFYMNDYIMALDITPQG